MTREQRIRFDKGLTVTAVAEGAGLSRKTVRRFESGAPVNAPVAKALADFYEITLDELLGIDPEQEAA